MHFSLMKLEQFFTDFTHEARTSCSEYLPRGGNERISLVSLRDLASGLASLQSARSFRNLIWASTCTMDIVGGSTLVNHGSTLHTSTAREELFHATFVENIYPIKTCIKLSPSSPRHAPCKPGASGSSQRSMPQAAPNTTITRQKCGK